GMCIDSDTDVAHCGGCGMTCMPAPHAMASCAGGRCGLGPCNPQWADCNRDAADGCEINIRTDVANCGACGTVCKLEHATAGCSDTCFLSACDFGFDDCNGNPKDGCETTTLDDVKNCGG